MYKRFFFIRQRTLALHAQSSRKRKENIQFSLMLLTYSSYYTYKRPIFGATNFTDFEFDSIKYNMPYLCIPAYMMLLRKSVISLDFHKCK